MKEDPKGKLSADVMSALNSAEVEQVIQTPADRHQEWLNSRRGKITGSNFGKLMKQPRSKADKEAGELAETAKTYLKDVISEILGAPHRDLDLYQFQWGHKYEPIAIKHYEKKEDVEVEFKGDDQKCFTLNEYIGATPDGIVYNVKTKADHTQDVKATKTIVVDITLNRYGIEVKCPENATHHLTHILLKDQEDLKKKKPDYYWQCVGGMFCSGLNKWKFISFYPDYEDKYKMKVIIIKRNEADIEFLSKQLGKAKKYLDKTLKEIKDACTD